MNIATLILSFGLLMIAMTIHEFAHAFVAYKLGDTTAKYSGRLTLNPLAHLDPIWTVLLPLFLYISTNGRFIFGAAKPVPINYYALNNPKRDVIWVGISGPLANFIFALMLSILWNLLKWPSLSIRFIMGNLIVMNVVLGVFNLMPIPPLDGSRILMGILPNGISNRYASIERYGFIILILLFALGIFDYIMWPLVESILRLLGVSL